MLGDQYPNERWGNVRKPLRQKHNVMKGKKVQLFVIFNNSVLFTPCWMKLVLSEGLNKNIYEANTC
jgi:hypothetical protein